MMKSDQIFHKIVSDLKVINPQKIIVFGSFAKNKFIEGDSDIDLLIIKETTKKPAERYSEARLSLSLEYPFDIFVLTEKELKDRVSRNFFFRNILNNGKVIYESQ